MMRADPRALAPLLDDLAHELLRWSSAADAALEAALATQRQADEQLDRLAYRAALAESRAEQDRADVEAAQAEVARSLVSVWAARRSADLALKESEELLAPAREKLRHWESELEHAHDRLTRGRARLTAALDWHASADRALHRATVDLRRAETGLSRCRADQRRSCWTEQLAVTAARSEASRTETEFEAARVEREMAEDEVVHRPGRGWPAASGPSVTPARRSPSPSRRSATGSKR